MRDHLQNSGLEEVEKIVPVKGNTSGNHMLTPCKGRHYLISHLRTLESRFFK